MSNVVRKFYFFVDCTDLVYKNQVLKRIDSFVRKENKFEIETSGSTGAVKKVTFTYEQVMHAAAMSTQTFRYKADWKALLCLPIQKVAGMMLMARCVYVGMHGVVVDPKLDVSEYIKKHKPNLISLSVAQWKILLESHYAMLAQSNLKLVLLGGEALYPSLEASTSTLPFEVYHTYGMTETLSHVGYKKLGMTGGYSTVVDAAVQVNADGIILVKNHATKYAWLKTNDIGLMLEDGTFSISGRADFTINSGGKKILPEVLESTIYAILSETYTDLELCVSAQSDLDFGEHVVLVLQNTDSVSKPGVDVVYQILAERLHKHELPKQIVYIAELPRLGNGKLDRAGVKSILEASSKM